MGRRKGYKARKNVRCRAMKKINRRLLWVLLLACSLLGGAFAQDGAHHFRVGITAFRDKASTVREWQATMDYLSSRIPGARFDVVPLNLPEFEAALRGRQLDFLITNPQHYIAMENRFGVSRVATLVKSENGKIVNRFGGVIFARADRTDLQELRDLRGKRIAATDATSFAAYLVQYDLFLQEGMDLPRDTRLNFMGFPQDLSVLAVLQGTVDAGFARSGLLESMAREGKIDLGSLRVLHPVKHEGFPFLVSSQLFPEWPLAAAPHVPIEVTNRVVAALLEMQPDAPAARSGRYYRWSTPVEYLSVQSFMQRIRAYPFDQPEPLTAGRILREYATPIVVGAALICVLMAALYWRAFRLNRELVRSRLALREMAHYDMLTQLPNRNLLDDRVEQALAHARRADQGLAICMLDLDGFKPINDRHGHALGDRVLRDVAQRIKAAVRGGDTVARFGGDEFVVLLDGFSDERVLDEVLARVCEATRQGFDYCSDCRVSASIGVSIFGQDAHDAATMLRHADEAMYLSKNAGGDRFTRYVPR